MSREIKFRVWDKFRNEYYESPEYVFISVDGKIGLFEGFDRDFLFGSYQDIFLIEQYTGLKDKNGVEIYEGDVVEVRSHLCKDVIGIVKFWEFNSSFVVIKNSKEFNAPTNLSATIDGFASYEVIGNVHENPELLRG